MSCGKDRQLLKKKKKEQTKREAFSHVSHLPEVSKESH